MGYNAQVGSFWRALPRLVFPMVHPWNRAVERQSKSKDKMVFLVVDGHEYRHNLIGLGVPGITTLVGLVQ